MTTATEIQLSNHEDRLKILEEIARNSGENLAVQRATQKTLCKQLETVGSAMERQVEKLGETLGDKIDILSGSVEHLGGRVASLEEKLGNQGQRISSLEQSRRNYEKIWHVVRSVAAGLLIAALTWGVGVMVEAAGK